MRYFDAMGSIDVTHVDSMRAIPIRGGSVTDGRWCNEAEHGQ